jgi:hypothetical protein
LPIGIAGQSAAALPRSIDIDLFGDLERVVDLDAEVANGTFDPDMAGTARKFPVRR